MTEKGIVLVVSVTLVQGDQVLIIQENKPSVRDTWNFPGASSLGKLCSRRL